MDNNFLNIGQKVWCINMWGTIDEGIISEVYTTQSDLKYYKIQLFSGGVYNSVPEDIFTSRVNALHEKARRSRKKVDEYKINIKTLKDLLEFCICQMNNDNINYEAIQTVKEWSKDILSIDLDEE